MISPGQVKSFYRPGPVSKAAGPLMVQSALAGPRTSPPDCSYPRLTPPPGQFQRLSRLQRFSTSWRTRRRWPPRSCGRCSRHEGDWNDESLPEVSHADDLRPLIGLTNVHVLDVFRDGAACIGFEFGCVWDE